ncbi:MAG: rhodanese-like domain-containing protein [Verrucomicrobiales bacterium]|nr:rhodanese-like domain-containing protein [Verrucomicrobiales bacterium]
MRPQAILIVAGLFLFGILLIALGPGSYRKVGDIQTLEAQSESLRSEYPEFEHLRPATLAALLDRNVDVLIIDVRRTEEFQVSRIPGAVHLDTSDKISRYLTTAAPLPEVIVFYSASGVRAAKLLSEMPEKWPLSAANLAGGIFAWANEGRLLINDSEEETRQVHPESRFHGRFLAPENRFPIEEE